MRNISVKILLAHLDPITLMSVILAIAIALGAVSATLGIERVMPPKIDPAFVDGEGRPAELPAPAIILFYANWCAPCRAEIKSIDDLARAASPVPIIVVPWDAESRTRQALRDVQPSQIRYATGGGYRLLAKMAGPSGGLPVVIALNAKSEPCIVRREGLVASAIKGLLGACR